MIQVDHMVSEQRGWPSEWSRSTEVPIASSRNRRHKEMNLSVDKKNQLDVTFCILYFSS